MGNALRRDAEFRRILVVITRQIGDVLLTTPLISAARQRWPKARIDVLGFAGTLGILAGNPDIDELIQVKEGSGWWESVPVILRLFRRYDLALVAQYTDRAHLYGWLSAGVRSGQTPAGKKGRWKRLVLQHAVELGKSQSHVLIEKLRLLEPWIDLPASATVTPPKPAALPDDIANRLGPRYLVMQVPSLVRYKQWPVRHYAGLIRELVALGERVVVTGGPSAQDRATVDETLSSCAAGDAVVDACGKLNFNQLTTLLQNAALYLGPDTSITHLAAACGTPVVALFGPTNPKIWGPWPDGWPPQQPYEKRELRQQRGNIVLLQGPQTCVPCNLAGCDGHRDSRAECLETMDVQRVLGEAKLLLQARSAA
jgi:heptosyltransferase-3